MERKEINSTSIIAFMRNFVRAMVISQGFLVLAFCTLPTISQAETPTISGVSGKVASGEIVTILGKNLVSEDSRRWSTFFDEHPDASGFEGISYRKDGYSDNGSANSWPNFLPVYDADVRLMGKQSVRFHQEGTNGNSNMTSYMYHPSGLPDCVGDVWIRFYNRWDWKGNFASSHIKMFDVMGGGGCGGYPRGQYYAQPSAGAKSMMAVAGGGFNSGTPTPKGNAISYNIPGGLVSGRWYCWEIHLKNDEEPYVFDMWMDGKKIITGEPRRNHNIRSMLLGIINQRNADERSTKNHYWDGYAYGSTRIFPASAIEISDREVYGSGKVVYQETRYLSDDKVQVSLDLSGFRAGPLYLWVTNNLQMRSSAYPLRGE